MEVLSRYLPDNISISYVIPNIAQTHAAVVFNSDNFNKILLIDLKSGEVLSDISEGYQAEWDGGQQLFYTTIDSTLRPHSVYVLDIYNLDKGPELVYRNVRDDGIVTLARTKDLSHLTININTKKCSEVNLVRSGERQIHNIIKMEQGKECYIEHRHSSLLAVVSDDHSLDLILEKCTLDSHLPYPNIELFTTLYEGGVIHDMEVFSSGVVLYTSNNMMYSMVLITDDGSLQSIDFPLHVSQVIGNQNTDYNQSTVNIVVKSYVKRNTELSISFNNFILSTRRRIVDNGPYNILRLTAPSTNNTDIPITVISKGLLTSAPYTVFQCYGCYGQILDHSYETLPHSLLEEGCNIVICHTRGGGEMGRSWYHAGIGDKKIKAIEDTVNCIELCHDFGISSPSTAFLQAYSAGCVIAAAVVNRNPGTVIGLILQMPFLDLETAMRDPSLALSTEEKDEWGDYTKLCPVRNNTNSTHVCLTLGGQDLRSPPWHTANYIISSSPKSVWVNFLKDSDHNVPSDTVFQQKFINRVCWNFRDWLKKAW